MSENLDTNYDGVTDQVAYDTDGDGYTDHWELDTNQNGYIDQEACDTNADGVADTWYIDSNEDASFEETQYDTNGDGYSDTSAAPSQNDYSTYSSDVNGDGFLDTVTNTPAGPTYTINTGPTFPDTSMTVGPFQPYGGDAVTNLMQAAQNLPPDQAVQMTTLAHNIYEANNDMIDVWLESDDDDD